MNAYELANELAFKHIAGDESGAFSGKIIDTLRQQQAEIEALTEILANEGIEVGQEYLDECVAEIRKAER
jgi:hypothetical protein